MSNRWAPIRRLAIEEREAVTVATTAQGEVLVRAALEARYLVILRLASDDPLLRGGRAVYNDYYVAYDRSLNPQQLAFALAHELGHAVMHDASCHCAEADMGSDNHWNRKPG